MNNLLTKSGWLAAGALGLALSANADVLLNNTTTPLASRFSDGGTEFGNQIFLSNGGYITNFSFEYYGIGGGAGGAFVGPVTAEVRWYLNNGPLTLSGYATPGTVLYDSGAVPITAPGSSTHAATLDFSTSTGDFPTVPAGSGTNGWFVGTRSLTFTVQFAGMNTSAGDQVGVDLYSPPTVGQMYIDYWQNNGTAANPSWAFLEDAKGTPIDIGQEWMGTAVPEPSTLALSVVGGLGLLMAVRRFRSQ
jgi:hypothetical protein